MKIVITSMAMVAALAAGNFTLTSSNLQGQMTKAQEFNGFGCSGENRSPKLSWKNLPKGTKSLALTVYDPDAPTGSGWWHWIVVNIPTSTTSLPEAVSAKALKAMGATQTNNDYGMGDFGGACPPQGDKAHQYIFTIHALDVAKLDVNEKSDSALVGYYINAHTIQKSSLVSYYKR